MKLPKEIYVSEQDDEPHFFTSAEECVEGERPVTVGVYKLVGTVEVFEQTRREVVVKKSPKKAAKKPVAKPAEEEQLIALESPRNSILDEMRVTG